MDTEAFAALLEDTAGIDARSLSVLHREPGEAPIWHLTVPIVNALGIWTALRDVAEQTGHWPVLIGEDWDVEVHRLNLTERRRSSAGEILQWAEQITESSWLAEHYTNAYSEPPALPEVPDNVVFDIYLDDDIDVGARTFVFALIEANQQPFKPIHLALVPTTHSWEVPAYLQFNDWNSRPYAEVHTALFRRWKERHGAELVVMTGTTVEMLVPAPVDDRQAAWQLASEHAVYCPGEYREDPAGERIGGLSRDSVWFFWWD